MRFLSVALLTALACAGHAGALTLTYPNSTTTIHERAAEFQSAELSGLQVIQNHWSLTAANRSGTATSQPITVPAFDELIPSWNSVTGKSGSVSVEVRVQTPAGWSRWYSFGRWSAAAGRSSADSQKDSTGQVNTDTLRLNAKATTFQYRVTLRGEGTQVRLVAFNTSDRSKRTAALDQPSDKKAWGKTNVVPQRSQMIYPDGGEVWCSPTSVSMILADYGLNVTVPEAAKGMYDRAYDGTGNWPFNTAYAGELGLRAFVTRLPSLAAAEKFTGAGVPLAVSLGWKKGELPGAPLGWSNGHLMVLVGFDAKGNPVLNDPAAPSNDTVRRTYPRAAFEKLWLTHSGGVAYVIAPSDADLP